ncbi:MAG: CHAT domain-containing protein [Deltaproteobacteria bacterium]|nr:CHAT domain-containing protein [Deltaproteobacteria bacterium]
MTEDTELRVSVGAAAEATVEIEPRASEFPSAERGRRSFVVRPGREADAISVRVEAADGSASSWTLALAPFEEVPALVEAQRARAARELDRALEVVESALADGKPAAGLRARLLAMRARVRIAKGARAEAEQDLREAMALERQEGLISDEVRDGMALTWLLVGALRFGEAHETLAALAPAAGAFDEAKAYAPYYEAILLHRAGDPRGALRNLEEAERAARRLGMEAVARDSRQTTALVLQELGRFEEAGRILEGLAGEASASEDPCQRATLLTNLGWTRLLLGEAGRQSEPLPVLEEALAIWRSSCAAPAELGNALVNLSLAELQRGDIARARERLREAVAAGAADTAVVEAWRLDLEGRLALATGEEPGALDAFEALDRLAREASVPDAALRAALGRGDALAALGRPDEALAAWDAAEGLLDQAVRAVPLGEGQGAFLASATRGPRAHVDLLMSLGRVDEALAVARRSRTRELTMLRQLRALAALGPEARARWEAAVAAWRAGRRALDAAAEDDWKLAADGRAAAALARADEERALRRALDDALAMAAPEPAPQLTALVGSGELALVTHPGRRGTWVFAVTEAGARAVHLGALPSEPGALAAALLEPFRAELQVARRLRVLAFGPLREVDFQSLPWEGGPLAARLPVVYAVDLPPLAGSAPNRSSAALVVADPARNLAGAQAEVGAVRALLAQGSGAPVELTGPEATLAAVQERLPEAGLFHFAGHGWFGGLGGWESALGLAGGQRLTVGDILALPRVPATVVLSGCETGRSDRSGPGASLGLAESFVIAGAEAVVAATRPVDDALAQAMSEALYQEGQQALRADPASALARAQAHIRAEQPDADWASFRLIVP